jgi:hypothetical protein
MMGRVRQLKSHFPYLIVLKSIVALFLLISILYRTFPDGSETNVALSGYVPITTNAMELSSKFGLSDNHFYVQTGMDIADGGTLSSDSQFSLRQWAPGMPIFLGGILKIFGPNIPLGVAWGLFSAFLWSLIFLTLVSLSKTIKSVLFIGLAISILLLTPPFTKWFYSGGYFYTEGVAIAFGAIALLSLKLPSKKKFYISGGSLALAAYFKGTFEFVGVVLTILAIFFFLLYLVQQIWKIENRFFKIFSISELKEIGIIVGVFNIATIPWRIWSNIYLYPYSFTLDWTAHTSQYWGHRWMPSKWLNESGSSWFSNNGGNSACILDLEKCKTIGNFEIASGGNFSGNGHYTQSEFLKLSLETFLSNPLSWFSSRIPFLRNAWFPFEVDGKLDFLNLLFLVTFICTSFFALKNLIRLKAKNQNSILHIFFLAVVCGTLGPLLIQEIEPRYLYPVQIMSMLLSVQFFQSWLDKLGRNRF